MVRTTCSSNDSRLRRLSSCSVWTSTISLCSKSSDASHKSALRARCCSEPSATIWMWLSRSIITFLVMLDMPLVLVHRRSGRVATALGMILWISCVMMPSWRLEKNLLKNSSSRWSNSRSRTCFSCEISSDRSASFTFSFRLSSLKKDWSTQLEHCSSQLPPTPMGRSSASPTASQAPSQPLPEEAMARPGRGRGPARRPRA
mmetsp:Transcript_35753/g.93359  ORF Transcript_35753/g.93359 Transcript_35753/m.93359 type:complete len:202 (+) Transcript_35753:2103-2708(+)